jgi:hypothetical protein
MSFTRRPSTISIFLENWLLLLYDKKLAAGNIAKN